MEGSSYYLIPHGEVVLFKETFVYHLVERDFALHYRSCSQGLSNTKCCSEEPAFNPTIPGRFNELLSISCSFWE